MTFSVSGRRTGSSIQASELPPKKRLRILSGQEQSIAFTSLAEREARIIASFSSREWNSFDKEIRFLSGREIQKIFDQLHAIYTMATGRQNAQLTRLLQIADPVSQRQAIATLVAQIECPRFSHLMQKPHCRARVETILRRLMLSLFSDPHYLEALCFDETAELYRTFPLFLNASHLPLSNPERAELTRCYETVIHGASVITLLAHTLECRALEHRLIAFPHGFTRHQVICVVKWPTLILINTANRVPFTAYKLSSAEDLNKVVESAQHFLKRCSPERFDELFASLNRHEHANRLLRRMQVHQQKKQNCASKSWIHAIDAALFLLRIDHETETTSKSVIQTCRRDAKITQSCFRMFFIEHLLQQHYPFNSTEIALAKNKIEKAHRKVLQLSHNEVMLLQLVFEHYPNAYRLLWNSSSAQNPPAEGRS